MAVALAAAALAAVALMVSVSALRVARDHRRASSVAEASPLRVSVTEGQARRALADDTRDYALLLSLGNESTAPIVVSACQLRVTYRTRANFLGAVDLEPRSAPDAQAGRPVLELPVPVPPGLEGFPTQARAGTGQRAAGTDLGSRQLRCHSCAQWRLRLPSGALAPDVCEGPRRARPSTGSWSLAGIHEMADCSPRFLASVKLRQNLD